MYVFEKKISLSWSRSVRSCVNYKGTYVCFYVFLWCGNVGSGMWRAETNTTTSFGFIRILGDSYVILAGRSYNSAWTRASRCCVCIMYPALRVTGHVVKRKAQQARERESKRKEWKGRKKGRDSAEKRVREKRCGDVEAFQFPYHN